MYGGLLVLGIKSEQTGSVLYSFVGFVFSMDCVFHSVHI